MSEEIFAFRGVGRFIALGAIGCLVQIGAGLGALREALRGKGGSAWAAAGGLGATGIAGLAAILSCRDAAVRLTDDGVAVRFGWVWRQSVPYTTIAAAVPMERAITDGLGIRTDFRGTVAVVPWGRRVVALDLAPPRDLPLFLFIKQKDARRLLLGVEDRERFVSAVMQRVLSTAHTAG